MTIFIVGGITASAGTSGARPLGLLSWFFDFESQFPHSASRETLAVLSERVNEIMSVPLCGVTSGALSPIFPFHSSLRELLLSLCTSQALSLPWWPQTVLPSFSLEVHDYESCIRALLPQQCSKISAFWVFVTIGDSPGSHLVIGYSWKCTENHKHSIGLRVKGGSNPCSANLLGIGPLILSRILLMR